MSSRKALFEKRILAYQSSKRWYDSIQSEQTRRVYLNRLRHYCTWAKKTPDELIGLKLQGLQNLNGEKEFQAVS